MADFKLSGTLEYLDNMYVLHVDGGADVPFPFTDQVTQVDASVKVSEYVEDNNINVINKDEFSFLVKVEPVNEEDDSPLYKVYEMSSYDIKDRKILTSFKDFTSAYEKASELIKYDKKNDPMKDYKHDIKRHELFMHEIFGNNYRMFGLEDKFDIDNPR